ncbi:VCBS domain-containing protein [Vibrio aestuarianus]|uniref:VCBS domain-containing protein n=1 Tax=Vibrio aestuarianus TaxID=28171 RepID=UPI00237C59B7|nr:VCBS domain-containing protein [Vibrio aestuarianus]MDE1249233.1 VCBS domain-containing protein [Vibrio aestuarianus]
MANKKNIETNKKSNELEQKKATQKKKLRLHSHLKVNIPLFQSLIMILPSLAKHASAEGVDNYSNEANRATENSVAEKDVTDDHGKANSSAVTHQESPTSENHVGSTLSVSHAPHGSNSHLVPSHHLSTFSHPQVHYIPSISMPTISLESNGQPTHSNNTPPTTPASPVTFVSEVIKGAYGELHVDANGQYTFVLNPNSPQYILLNQNKHGTDHFVLNLSDGSKIVVQIPVTGKQDTPTISGDLAGVVTEDHKVDSHGLLHANGKIDVIDPDQNESSMKPEVLAGKYGSLSIDADGHWQYHVDNSLSNIQALTSATSLHESFVIHTQDGTPQTLDMTIGGNDDNAVVTGIDTGVVTEDVTTQIQGQLTVNDSDLGENHFQASQINGHLGTLTITKDGAWAYALDNSNPAVQRLAQGSTATDIITVHSADGTAHQVTVTITGTGDAATIGGVDTGSITENSAGVDMSPDYAHSGIATLGNTTLYADGKLTITDPDVGESGFERQGSNGYDYHGTYGDLILLTDGTWHYHADAGHLSGIGARPTTRGTAIDQLGEGQSLTDTITVHSKDGTTHDIVITIHGSNDRPYCSSEVVLQSGCEDTRQTLTTAQLLANTVDVDANDAGKLTIENLHVDHGSILNNADGTFTFTPEKDYNGDVHFSYDVKDAHGGMTHTGASTTLAAVQDNAVIAGIDIGSVTEDLNPHASVQGNYAYKLEAQGSLSAIDPDKDESGFDFKTLISAAMHPEWRPYSSSLGGQLAIDPKGNWNYYIDNRKPEIQHLGKGETLTDTVTVHSKDGTTHDIVITIHGTNDAPTVSSEVQLNSGKEDSVQTITAADLLAHATDIDNNDQGQLTVANLIANHGSIRDNQDGTYTFTPEKDYNGVVQFNYDVIDRHGGITHTGATINLVAVNDASVLASELSSNEVIEDHLSGSSTHTLTSYWKNLDITDTDGQTDAQIVKIEVNGVEHNVPANFAITLQGAHGSFVTTHGVDGHNKWRYVADNNHTEIQQLKDGQSLTDHMTLITADGTRIPITATIIGTEDHVIIDTPDSLTASIGTAIEDKKNSLSGTLQAHDVDKDDSVHFQTQNLTGNFGSFSVAKDGTWHYQLDATKAQHLTAGQNQAEGFDIVAISSDGSKATHHIQINVQGSNDSAIIAGVDTGSVIENSAGVDMSPDYAQPGIATLGNTTLYADGKLTITDPDVGESGFERQGSNGYDYHGTYGDLILLTDGTWHYHADAGHLSGIGARPTTRGTAIDQLGEGQSLTDTITVHSKDGTTHDIVITIHGSNDRPYCSSEVVLANGSEDTRQTLTTAQLLANTVDVDANDAGKLTIENLHVDHGSILNNADGTFTFTPEKDYNGDVHFSYDVKDAHGGVTHTGATTNLAAVNDNPDVMPLTDSVSEGADNHHTLNLLVGATDKDGDALTISHLEYAIDGQPQSGQLPTGITLDADGHTLIVDATDPAFNHLANGQSQQIAITYQVEDGHGGSTQQTATLTIAGTDDKAKLVSNVIQLTETQALDSEFKSYRGQLQLIDPDSGDNTQFVFSGKYLGQGFEPGHLDVWPNGTYQFRLDAGTNRHADELIGSLHAGESMELPYEVETSDGQKLTIMVKVTGEDNQAKIAVTPYSSLNNHVYEDHTSFGNTTNQLSSGGTLQVIDPDHDQAGFIAQTITTAEGGRFNINAQGHWSYNIDNDKVQHLGAGESFQQTFTVESIDGSAKKDITVTVHGTNDVPVASAEVRLANGLEDSKIVLTPAQLLANSSDVDDNDIGKLSIENLQADHGAIALNTDGTFTFTPEKDYNGDVHFSYDVKDAHGGVTHTGASTTLSAVGDAAIFAGDKSGQITEDRHVQGDAQHTIFVTGVLNVIDPDAGEDHFYDTRNAHALSDPYGGHLTIGKAGDWAYSVPNANIQHLAAGQVEQVQYEVTTAGGDKQVITLYVHGTNDKPIISEVIAGAHNIDEDAANATSGQIIISDVDHSDQHAVSIDSQHPPQYGSVSYNNNSQTWVYTLNNNNAKVNALNDGDKLTDKFSILVDDGHGGVTQQEIEMSINGHSDIPPMPTLVAPAQISGSAGHQDLHASIGFPPIIHQGTPTPMTGWGISDHHGHSLTALHGQFGTLHVNPATGELSYDYQQPSSGVVKTHTGGSYGNGTDETDSFVLTLGGNQNSQVAVHLHLHSQSVHGNSGHHIDQTTLTGMDIAPINSPAPAATVQHDEPDVQEATTDEFSVDIIIDDDSVSSYLSEDTNEEIQGEHADSSSVTGAVAYLDALGINPTQQLTGNDEQHSPADMDLVWAQSEQATLVDEHGIHIDVSDALSDQDHQQSDHHSRDHDENYGDQQHQIDNLPEIDPNS